MRKHRLSTAGRVFGFTCSLLVVAIAVAPLRGQEEPETDGRETLQAAVQAEIERATAALDELVRFRESLDDARTREEAAARAALDRAAAFRLTLDESEPGTEAVDRLFDDAVAQTVRARGALREALTQRTDPSSVPEFRSRVDLSALRGSTVADEASRLEALLAAIDQEVVEARALEFAQREDLLRIRWDVVARLNDVRVRALNRLSDARRQRVLGLSRDGVAQFRREVDHLGLAAQVFVLTRRQAFAVGTVREADPFSLGAATWSALKSIGVLFLAGWLWRRRAGFERTLGKSWLGSGLDEHWRHRLNAAANFVRPAAPWLYLILVVEAVNWALGSLAGRPEIEFVRYVVEFYALYRAATALLAGLLTRLGVADPEATAESKAATNTRIFRSVRAVLRVAFLAAVPLWVVSRAIGAGYIYHAVFLLGVAFAALVLMWLVFHWRREIVDAYLNQGASGGLGRAVRRSRDRWYAGFVALAALVVLATRGSIEIGRRFVLGFDQTRRALAFLFRRRIEKQAERLGYAPEDAVGTLAAELVESLTEGPVRDERLAVDYYPGMDQLAEAVESWQTGGGGGSFLLTGDYGIGRTSWLEHVDLGELPIARVTFEERIPSSAVLGRVLGAGLGVGECAGEDELAGKILAGPPTVVALDRGQNLFLGRVGGYEGFEAFISLMDSTSRHVFWIVSFSELAWGHVASVHPQLAGFRHHLRLEPWPEERIRELIRRRVEAAGAEVVFDDLMLEARPQKSRRALVAEAEEGYSRMLWDSSMGLPRVALNYWKRSLVAESATRVRVRLFVPPPIGVLERMGDIALFIIGAITVHESLTIPEVAVVTRYSERLCRTQITRLRDLGVVHAIGARYWITSYWQPVVSRLLARHNLISD